MSVDYMKDDKVKEYYEKWVLNNGRLVGHDKEYFYQFVKAVLALDSHATTELLKLALCDSFAQKFDNEVYDKLVYDASVMFEALRDFYNVSIED